VTFKQSREVRADITGTTGRVRAWTTDRESDSVSLAVVGDRCVMSSADARALAKWLEEQADAYDRRHSIRTASRPTSSRNPVWS